MRPVRNRIVAGDGDPRHGTAGAYHNHHCRCSECTEAHRRMSSKRRYERCTEEPPEHGKASIYTNWGCRCDECRQAHAEARRAQRARKATP